MCGRYGRFTPIYQFADLLGAKVSPHLEDEGGYNLPPGTFRACALRSPDTGALTIGPAWWNFIASNAENRDWEQNASRTERADRSRLFKRSFLHQRCVLPVDVYYEWHRKTTPKQPFAIRPKGQSQFFLAGIWSKASNLPSEEKPAGHVTFAVMTRAAPPALSAIHHRQPQVLDADGALAWLDCEDDAEALHRTLDARCLTEYEPWKISTLVNNAAKNNGPQILKPLEERGKQAAH